MVVIIANNMPKVALHAVARVLFGVILQITCWICSSEQGTKCRMALRRTIGWSIFYWRLYTIFRTRA